MNRDDLILHFMPFINNIVKKFNDNILDEDLLSEATLALIKVVDRHIVEKGSMNPDDIEARVYVWCRNRILDYKNKSVNNIYNYIDIDVDEIANNDNITPMDYINKEWFNEIDYEFIKLWVDGYSNDDISNILNITLRQVSRKKIKIRNILSEKLKVNRTI